MEGNMRPVGVPSPCIRRTRPLPVLLPRSWWKVFPMQPNALSSNFLQTLAFLLVTAAAGLVCSCGEKKSAGPTTDVKVSPAPEPGRDWTKEFETVSPGRRVRMVWTQHAAANAADTSAAGNDLLLVGIDSADGRGIRLIQPEKRNYRKPLMRADGAGVIFTDVAAGPKMFLCAFEGGPLRELGVGMALQVWRDPAAETEWIFAAEALEPMFPGGEKRERIVRFQTEKPEEREVMWAQTPVLPDNFQVSRDGLRAVAVLSPPAMAVLNFQDSTWKELGSGIWPGLAPDDSYVSWMLNLERGALEMRVPNKAEPWSIPVAQAAGFAAGSLPWHLRWSNSPNVIAFSGPFTKAPTDPAFKDSEDGCGAEIFIARLSAGADGLQSVLQVTRNDRGDGYPDVWVEGPPVDTLAQFPQQPKEEAPVEPKPWPSNLDGVVFAWDHLGKDTALAAGDGKRTCQVTAKKFARFGRHLEMNVSGGCFEADADSNAALAENLRRSGNFTLEALISERRDGYDPQSVRLISYRLPDGRDGFALFRVDNSLVLRLLLGKEGEPALSFPQVLAQYRIDPDRPYHLAVTLYGKKLRCFADGALLSEFNLERDGLAAWSAGSLEIGDREPYGAAWTGGLESVAIYDRYLSEEEIRANFAAAKQKMAARRPADRVRLRAKLLETTPVPPKEHWGTYPRLLVVNTYQVDQVLAGLYEKPKMLVLHYAAMGGEVIPSLPSDIGQSYELTVEPSSQQPQLKSERIENAAQDVNLPLYLDVTVPGAGRRSAL